MKYQILVECGTPYWDDSTPRKDAKEELEKKVNNLIKEGWIPLGGVSVVVQDEVGSFAYAQAMIKH